MLCEKSARSPGVSQNSANGSVAIITTNKRRQNPPRPAFIEIRERERSLCCSARMMEVIRYPLMTKNTSTPTKPPANETKTGVKQHDGQ